MKIKKSFLETLIREELALHINGLTEAGKEQNSKKPEDKKAQKSADADAKEVPDIKDPADDELAADKEADDEEIDTKKAKSISKEIVGQQIQSITYSPKSLLLPGAKEIVITFDKIPDQFKILITKTGEIRYFFRGIHNQL